MLKLAPSQVKIEDKVFEGWQLELGSNIFRLSHEAHNSPVVDFVLAKLQIHGLTQNGGKGATSLYCQFDNHDGIIGVEVSTSDDENFDGFVEVTFSFSKHEDADTMFKTIANLLQEIDAALVADESSDGEEDDEEVEDEKVAYGDADEESEEQSKLCQ